MSAHLDIRFTEGSPAHVQYLQSKVEQQAARIKELEAERDKQDAIIDRLNRREAKHVKASQDLTALRQRIADAPAIGKVTTFGFGVCKDEPVFSWLVANPPIGATLISKEDLL